VKYLNKQTEATSHMCVKFKHFVLKDQRNGNLHLYLHTCVALCKNSAQHAHHVWVISLVVDVEIVEIKIFTSWLIKTSCQASLSRETHGESPRPLHSHVRIYRCFTPDLNPGAAASQQVI